MSEACCDYIGEKKEHRPGHVSLYEGLRRQQLRRHKTHQCTMTTHAVLLWQLRSVWSSVSSQAHLHQASLCPYSNESCLICKYQHICMIMPWSCASALSRGILLYACLLAESGANAIAMCEVVSTWILNVPARPRHGAMC